MNSFLFATAPTQPPIQPVPGVNRPGHETDHSVYLLPRLRTRGALPPFPLYVFMTRCLLSNGYSFTAWYLAKHWDNVTFCPMGTEVVPCTAVAVHGHTFQQFSL